MLLNRSKVHSAKLKISELKQKYSSDPILKKNEVSFNQPEENHSNDDGPNLVHVEHNNRSTDSSRIFDKSLANSSFDETYNTLVEQTVLEANKYVSFSPTYSIQESNSKQKSNIFLSRRVNSPSHSDPSNKISEIESNSKHESNFSSSSSLNNPSQSKWSSQISEIVNQLDNLCFISSSSDEQIKTITDLDLSYKPTNSTQTTEVTKRIQTILAKDEASIKLESEPIETKVLLKKSIASLETISPVRSSLKSRLENTLSEYSYSDTFTDASYKTSLENHDLSNLESNDTREISSESANVQHTSKLCKTENMQIGFQTDEKNQKQSRREARKSVTVKPFESINEDVNIRSNNMDISGKQLLKERSSKDKNDDSGPNFRIETTEADDTRIRKERKHQVRKKAQYNDSRTKQLKPNIGFNQSIKRPVLKSSKLIKNGQPIPAFTPGKQAPIFTKTSEELQYKPVTDSSGGHQQCEQIINNLLLNQIQLSRHFINSHHKMYLLCCEAAKKLSQDYVIGHKFTKTRLTTSN